MSPSPSESSSSKLSPPPKPSPPTTTQKISETVLEPIGLGNLIVNESELTRWKKNFEANCKTDLSGEKYLDEDSFINTIAPPSEEDFARISRRQFGILFQIADSSKKSRISLEEFIQFERLLKKPDAEFEVAFRFFDLDGNGTVDFEEFKRVFEESRAGTGSLPFDFESPWVKLYLGRRRSTGEHVLGYNEFTQLMKGLQGERLRQAFSLLDKDEDGYIRAEDFKRIILELMKHKLGDNIINQLEDLCNITGKGGKISYSEVIAFHNVIREMDLVESIVREGCRAAQDGKISQSDFLTLASRSTRYNVFSPLEVKVIFHFAGFGNQAKRLGLSDFAKMIDPKWAKPKEVEGITRKSGFLNDLLRSVYNFGLGGIAGGIGATFVYPIDLVKTRMQNQRKKVVGEVLYKNSFDCFKKVYKNEGLLGFYRGLPPQLVGVAPEKAIKLTVNDLIRGKTKNPETGKVSLPWELVAGGTAGGCQVVFTNPLEIVKIRLQMQGEMRASGAAATGAVNIIKSLGLFGLYKGAVACLFRDVPFSAIYFPAYSHLKSDVFGESKNGKKLSFGELLAAAAIAGMPAAYLTTPADVIKTRLQTEARKGETNYKGVGDAFTKILKEEGFTALFKGGPARIVRSSPQFGVTLVAYEYLHEYIPYPGDVKLPKAVSPSQDLSRIRARNALKILLDVHEDVGNSRRPAPAA